VNPAENVAAGRRKSKRARIGTSLEVNRRVAMNNPSETLSKSREPEASEARCGATSREARVALWAIVLAAGEGQRLAPVTRMLYGHPLPKQFAALDGARTLLQSTLDRVRDEIPKARTVVVVAKDQQELAAEQLAEYPGVQMVCQPSNAGTGPGILLGLSVVKAQAPEAMVVILPSDHHIDAPARFIGSVRTAATCAAAVPDALVLIGAKPDRPASDLGWIVPAEVSAVGDVLGIAGFVEKPTPARAERLFREGALWNTLVMVGRVGAFWRQAERHLARQTRLFNQYGEALASRSPETSVDHADRLLARLYRRMPSADFSRTVLEHGSGLSLVRLEGAGWSDCGTPERLLDCLGIPASSPDQILKDIVRTIQGRLASSSPLGTRA
jgi:mannose-1-phosphate guanylyltransferase